MPTSGHLMTTLGRISFELHTVAAPESCKAFIECLAAGQYDGGQFFRTVRSANDQGWPFIDVVQAAARSGELAPSIPHESTEKTGLRHRAGTLSLPRAQSGTATGTGFFVCLDDTPALDKGGQRNADGQGFAAFGRVTAGMDIVEFIHSSPCRRDGPDAYLLGQILEEPVQILETLLDTDPG